MSRSISRPWGFRSQVRDSKRDHLAHRPHGSDPICPLRQNLLFVPFPYGCSSSGCCEVRLLSETGFGAVAPHAMQDHGKFAGDCDACPRHSPTPGNPHAPSPQARPFFRPQEQRMGCFIKGSSSDFVTTSADPALDVGLAGLIARRC